MIQKYLIMKGMEFCIAMKWHPQKKELTVGGHGSMREDMVYIVKSCFGMADEKFEEKWTQRNKVRFVFNCLEEDLNTAITYMDGLGYTIRPVREHGRLMR